MAPAQAPPSLQDAIQSSISTWQHDLQSLFEFAKDRFPDIVWELLDVDGEIQYDIEEVWGHKAIVYARAPPSFQARYFSYRPAQISSYSSPPNGTLDTQSALSLSLGPELQDLSPSSSPYHAGTADTLLRLPIAINSTIFSNELEYLYTGKGFAAVFEFLFDVTESREEGDAEENIIDKLRNDLIFMWRSRLYSDVRITLTGGFLSSNHESTMATSSSHRFMLASRSPYFQTQLHSLGVGSEVGEPLTLPLPSPPFTPTSLHFTLGFIYTGTLVFSPRSYDLDTAFQIMRSATYLSIDSLYDEIQARIVQEMMHGLFHAFLEPAEYERITSGKWGTGGCRCRQCARRAPRVLEFALSDDVKNSHLERGARRALVALFGEGWCISEFASLSQKIRENLLEGLAKRTTPMNIFALLFAAQNAMSKLNMVTGTWADVSREMLLIARKTIDDVLCFQAEECFEQPEWLELMEANGARFEDEERVGWVVDSVKRGLGERSAGMVYQTLVSSILLRPHGTETDAPMLPPTSWIRMQVEETRMDLLRWLRRRWMGVRQEGGFNALEVWAVKEISEEIEVPVENLINPSPSTPVVYLPTRPGLRPTLGKFDLDADFVSLLTSVLSRNSMKCSITPSQCGLTLHSSASSVARSTMSSTRVPDVALKRPDLTSGPRSGSMPLSSTSVTTVSTWSIPMGNVTPRVSPTPRTLITQAALEVPVANLTNALPSVPVGGLATHTGLRTTLIKTNSDADSVMRMTPLDPLSNLFTRFKILWQIVKQAHTSPSQQQFRTLAYAIAELLQALDGDIRARQSSNGEYLVSLDGLQIFLIEIVAFIRNEESRTFLGSLLTREDRIYRIEEYLSKISSSVSALQVLGLVNTKEWWSRNDEARRIDQQNLVEKFDALEEDQDQLMKALNTETADSTPIIVCLQRRLDQQAYAEHDREQQFFSHTLQLLNTMNGFEVEVENWMITSYEVEFGQRIGFGGFGEVFKGIWNGADVAIKIFRTAHGGRPSPEAIRKEIKVWSNMRHAHILQFLGANEWDDRPFIVMPYLKNGNARDYVRNHPDCDRLRIMHHISLGLLYLHNLRIAHGDLKALNVLVDNGGNAVLCDFGLSRIRADMTSRTARSDSGSHLLGSLIWLSPERLLGGTPKKPSDIYAFAMTMYEIYTNDLPFDVPYSYPHFVDMVARQNIRPDRPDNEDAPYLSDQIWELVENCWAREHTRRPTAKSISNSISQMLEVEKVKREAAKETVAEEA